MRFVAALWPLAIRIRTPDDAHSPLWREASEASIMDRLLKPVREHRDHSLFQVAREEGRLTDVGAAVAYALAEFRSR